MKKLSRITGKGSYQSVTLFISHSLDEDFDNIILENNPPPKILWLRIRNCSTPHLDKIIENKIDIINEFLIDEELDCLEIFDI